MTTPTLPALTVFAVPHPDDETLSFGSALRNHLRAASPAPTGSPGGRPTPLHAVHVLCLCDGSGSAAQAATGLTTAEFVAARDDELRRACRALGVPPGNVHLPPDRAPAGQLTAAHAAQLVRDLVSDLRAQLDPPPGHPVNLKTYTDLPAPHPSTGGPRHPDHAGAGTAARELLAAGDVTSVRLYVEPWLRSSFVTANPGVTLSAERTAGSQHDAAGLSRVLRALDEYADVDALPDPAAARWGIGYLSVGNLFSQLRQDPVNWYHLP